MSNTGPTDASVASSSDWLPDLQPITPNDKQISILLKGNPKSGKSYASYSLPEPIVSIYTDPNRSTVTTLQESGRQIDARRLTDWTTYEQKIIPAVRNRLVPAQTIVIDTADMLFNLMWQQIQGSKSKLAIQDFGTGLTKAQQTTYEMVSATAPTATHPGYNIVFNVHLNDVTDDGGALVKTAPALMGRFKDELEAFFDVVLLCRADEKIDVVDGKAQKTPVWRVLTRSPDKYNNCGAPSHWPSEFIMTDGQKFWDQVEPYWNRKKLEPTEAPDSNQTTTETTDKE